MKKCLLLILVIAYPLCSMHLEHAKKIFSAKITQYQLEKFFVRTQHGENPRSLDIFLREALFSLYEEFSSELTLEKLIHDRRYQALLTLGKFAQLRLDENKKIATKIQGNLRRYQWHANIRKTISSHEMAFIHFMGEWLPFPQKDAEKIGYSLPYMTPTLQVQVLALDNGLITSFGLFWVKEGATFEISLYTGTYYAPEFARSKIRYTISLETKIPLLVHNHAAKLESYPQSVGFFAFYENDYERIAFLNAFAMSLTKMIPKTYQMTAQTNASKCYLRSIPETKTLFEDKAHEQGKYNFNELSSLLEHLLLTSNNMQTISEAELKDILFDEVFIFDRLEQFILKSFCIED